MPLPSINQHSFVVFRIEPIFLLLFGKTMEFKRSKLYKGVGIDHNISAPSDRLSDHESWSPRATKYAYG